MPSNKCSQKQWRHFTSFCTFTAPWDPGTTRFMWAGKGLRNERPSSLQVGSSIPRMRKLRYNLRLNGSAVRWGASRNWNRTKKKRSIPFTSLVAFPAQCSSFWLTQHQFKDWIDGTNSGGNISALIRLSVQYNEIQRNRKLTFHYLSHFSTKCTAGLPEILHPLADVLYDIPALHST